MTTHRYTLTISCPDRSGIIAAVTGFIAQHGGFIVEASYHTEQEAQRFFMRQEIRAGLAAVRCRRVPPTVLGPRRRFKMTWQLADSTIRSGCGAGEQAGPLS